MVPIVHVPVEVLYVPVEGVALTKSMPDGNASCTAMPVESTGPKAEAVTR
jgi:hypothetical protein